MVDYNLTTENKSLGGGINEVDDKIDFIEFNDINWSAAGTYSCPEGTYQRICDDIIHDRVIRIVGRYNLLICREGIPTGTPAQAELYYFLSDGSQSYQATFNNDDTVEISSWGKIILNEHNWAGNTLQFTEEGIYNKLKLAMERCLPVYVKANNEYALLQYVNQINSYMRARYIIESNNILRTIQVSVIPDDEVYLTVINQENIQESI